MKLAPASYSQMTAILRESASLWGAGFAPPDYFRMNIRLAKHPWSKDHFRHLVLLDKMSYLRSSCKVHELFAKHKNKSLRLALISELFTLPRERRRGFASTLMEMLLAQLREEGFDVAVLFSDLPTRFFTRFGFKEIKKYDLVFDLVIPAEPRKKIIEARHKVPEAVRSLYQKCCSPDFHIERSAAYWDMLRYKKTYFNRLQWDLGRESLLLCEDSSAYAWTLWTGQRLEIKDVAYKTPQAVADIMAYLLEKHGPSLLRQAYGWLPPSFERLPFVKSARYVERKMGIFMAADITGQNHRFLAMQPYNLHFWSLDRM
jgi:GNAT superfamily N-acetyltransferase